MKRLGLFWVFFCCLPACVAHAQQVQAFTGRVTDATGAVVPKTTVTAHNIDTGVDNTTTTTETGSYTIPYVIPGRYTVTASMVGFETAAHTGITLQVDQVATVDFTLKVGSAKYTVTVNADVLLDNGKADNGEVVENTRVTELPLVGGDPTTLSYLAAGVLNNNSQGNVKPFNNTQANVSVNGGGNGGMALMMDGISNSVAPLFGQGNANTAYVPPVSAVEEFKIVTNPYDAQYGLMAGAVEDITLKTGKNKLHGSVYENARRTWADANSWKNDYALAHLAPGADASGLGVSTMKWDQYGAELDGPVYLPKFYNGHDKTFFTLQYENFHELDPNTISTSVPSPQWLTGDFSNDTWWNGNTKSYTSLKIYDPLTGVCSTSASIKQACPGIWVRQAFSNNQVPSSRFNPVSQALLKLYPAPNVTPANGTDQFTNNYFKNDPSEDRYRNVLVKIDQVWSDKDRSSLSYSYWENVSDADGNGLPAPARNGCTPCGSRTHSFILEHIHTFTPQLFFDFKANVQAQDSFAIYGSPWDDTKLFGWSPDVISALGPQAKHNFPQITISGLAMEGMNFGLESINDSLNMVPSVAWIKRNHTIHAGLDLRLWQYDGKLAPGGPAFSFGGWTANQVGGYNATPTGNGTADTLLGVPASGYSENNPQYYESGHYFAPFVQDDWKITRKLTLNLGLRYDVMPSQLERHNVGNGAFDTVDQTPMQESVSVPGHTQLIGGITFLGVRSAGQSYTTPRSLYSTTWTNLQPRFGFAYSLDNKTVLRGGFGDSVKNPSLAEPLTNASGFSSNTSYQASDPNYGSGYMPNLAEPISDPYLTNQVTVPSGAKQGLATQIGTGISFINPNYKTPTFWNYSLGVERQLSKNDVVNVSYVGTRLYNGDSSDQLNRMSTSAILAKNCNPYTGGLMANCSNAATTNPFYGDSVDFAANWQMWVYPTANPLGLTVAYPQFSSVEETQVNAFHTWYNSLQVVADHHMNRGFVLHGTWTWSHLMDSGGWTDTTWRVPYRQVDGNDHTHIITISGVYNLPVGRGRAIGAHMNRVLDAAVGGWELSSIFTLQSGAPWSLSGVTMLHNPHVKSHIQKDSGDIRLVAGCVGGYQETTNTSGQNVDTYTLIPTMDYDGTCSQGADMNITTNVGSWMPQPNNVYQGVRLLRNDNIDGAFSKNFTLAEGMHLQTRLTAVNVPNHPVFASGPDTGYGSATFGEVVRSSGQSNIPRELQLSAKIVW